MSKTIKLITIYDKNGNPLEIKESLKSAFIGKGYFLKAPKQVTQGEEDGK